MANTNSLDGGLANLVEGGSGAKSVLSAPFTPRIQLVGQRCGISNGVYSGGLGALYASCHQRVLFPNGADAVQFVFPNFTNSSIGIGEIPQPPSMFTATGVILSGGTGYAVSEVVTFALTSTTGIAAVRVLITAVSSGVPTQYQVLDGGLYNVPLGAGVSQASTSGSGTGATATFTWQAGSAGMHIGLEPTFGSLVAAGQGAGSVVPVGKGVLADTSLGTSLLVPEGDFLFSDLIPIDIAIGGAVGFRISVGAATPTLSRTAITAATAPSAPSSNYESYNSQSTFIDLSVSGTFGSTTAPDLFTPALILGIPKQETPTVIAVADSRCWGVATGLNATTIAGYGNTVDVLDADGNVSWFEKALSRLQAQCYWPWASFSMPGDQLNYFLYNGSPLKGGMGRLKGIRLAVPTAVYLGLNVNDFHAGYTATQVQKFEQEAIALIRGLGVKYVFTDTTDPESTSTDSFASQGSQTVTAASAGIITRNTSLAAGTWANYDFFIDQRANVETTVNSGLWKTNGTANYYTGDGIHGSPQAITLKAATAAASIAANITL